MPRYVSCISSHQQRKKVLIIRTTVTSVPSLGIHVLAPSAVQTVEAVDKDKFPIMDFYLNNCDTLDIRGELKTDLHLLDVGKLDSLQAAEDFIANSEYQSSKTEN